MTMKCLKKLIEWRCDVPLSVVQMAQRRTDPLLRHYGHNITSINLETLITSVYMQGIEDCFNYYEKQTSKKDVQSVMGNSDAVPLAMSQGGGI